MDINFTRGFTLQEALEIAYNEDVDEIFIEPPDASVLTDEDSGDEDGGGLVDNLSGSQLRAQAEIRLKGYQNDSESKAEVEEDDDSLTPSTSVADGSTQPSLVSRRPLSTLPSVAEKNVVWIKGDLETPNKTFPEADYSEYKNLSCPELFELFFDDHVVQLLIDEATRYALFKNCEDPKISQAEMKCFLAILILSGYCVLPGKRYYWENSDGDMRNDLIYNAMRRNRFLQISRFLHCADNTKPDLTDKIWKMRPLMDMIKRKCLQHYQPEEHMNYDESMIKYFGRHSCKQFIRGKPVRFGYKMWCLNSKSGYLVNFEMYQGNNPRRSLAYEQYFGKAAAPFVTMLDELDDIKRKLPYRLYFDNLFTGQNLLVNLKERGYHGTGTIRENRIPKNCPLSDKKNFKKNSRGTYESIIDKDNGILFVRWADNGLVTIASTCHGVKPLANVKRYSQVEKKVVYVPRPNVIGQYNSYMGGTDLMDENVARYRISMRGKKWWWCLFSWLVDVGLHNAWQLHKKSGGDMPQLAFRRVITTAYLRAHGVPPKGPGRTSTAKSSLTLNRVPDELRYNRLDHLITFTQDKKRKRCAGEGCSSSVRTMCSKCQVGLCIECFQIFHIK